MAAKAALGALAIAGIGVAGVSLMSSEVVNFKTLHEDSDFTGNNKSQYDNKWGKDRARFLVGATEEYNNKWWDLSFKNNYQSITNVSDIKTSTFKNNSNKLQDFKKLRDACKGAYQGDSSKVKDNANTNDNNEFEESEIWKFCSPLSQKPTTVSEKNATSYTNKKGDNSSNKTKYISVTDENNNIFWGLKNKEFYDSTDSNNNNSGSKASDNTHFKKAFEQKTHVKKACEEAYQVDNSASGNGNPTDADILKYCSLTGK